MRGYARRYCTDSGRARQRGASLFVALIMVTTLMMFAIAMANLSGSQFRAVYNQQVRNEMERAGIEAIETVLNSQSFFNATVAGTAATQAITINGYPVQISVPKCYGTSTLQYSALSQVAATEINWEITATVTNPQTGSTVDIVAGVRMRMGADSCV